jgi:hypothetical protein
MFSIIEFVIKLYKVPGGKRPENCKALVSILLLLVIYLFDRLWSLV